MRDDQVSYDLAAPALDELARTRTASPSRPIPVLTTLP